MAHGDFIWCDLATSDPVGARAFYADIFGWVESGSFELGDDPYHILSCGQGGVAGIYEMPAKFQAMGLPNFWMSYIEVDDVSQAVETATRLGGKVELGPLEFGDGATVALIRDPLGAGFTVYQGPPLGSMSGGSDPGQRLWHALHTSDAEAVMPFYEVLFGWRWEEASDGAWIATSKGGSRAASLLELPESVRGRFVYWIVHFSVASIAEAERTIQRTGGRVASRFEDCAAGVSSLVHGPDEVGFCISEVPENARNSKQVLRDAPTERAIGFPWKSCLALAVLWGATLLEQEWVWGLMFLLWAVPALKFGSIYLLEDVRRDRNPVVFWLILLTWIVLSLLLIVYDLAPEWLGS